MSDTRVLITIQNYQSQNYTHITPIGIIILFIVPISSSPISSQSPLSSSQLGNVTFIEKCLPGVPKTFQYRCQYPDGTSYSITSRCDGSNSTLTTTCPARSRIPTCYVSSSSSSAAPSCELVSYTTTSMKCLCTACPSSSSSSRKLQTLETTTYQILAVTKYMFDDYAATMATAPNLTAENVAKSVIIIMSFVAVWTFVLFIIGIQEFWEYGKKVKETKKVRSDTNIVAGGADDSHDISISIVMKEYIDSYLPYVYKELTRSQQLSRQLLLNHKYFAILTNTKNAVDKTSKWVDGFHVLSMVSANMFILAMLFDLRYPADDGNTTTTNIIPSLLILTLTSPGSCLTFRTEATCLTKKTVFNTYCSWNPSSSSSSCTFNEPKFNLLAVVTLAWLQLIISVPLKTLIHYLFDNIIYAATSRTIEHQIVENHMTNRTNTTSRMIRRMSGAITSSLGRVGSVIGTSPRRAGSVIGTSLKGVDIKAFSANIKTTVTLQANFSNLRKSVISILQSKKRSIIQNKDKNDILIVGDSNAVDVDSSGEVFAQFFAEFNKHRNSLDDNARDAFHRHHHLLHHQVM